jgi:NADH:ubiquinone oxidoreductase subunit 6 (subunit J)
MLSSNILFNFFFLFFSGLAITSALFVIFSTNPIHSVLFLILVFLNASFVVLLLDLEVFSIFIIIIYIGAVMVLFTLCGFVVLEEISKGIVEIDLGTTLYFIIFVVSFSILN